MKIVKWFCKKIQKAFFAEKSQKALSEKVAWWGARPTPLSTSTLYHAKACAILGLFEIVAKIR